MRNLIITWWNTGRNGVTSKSRGSTVRPGKPGIQYEFSWPDLITWIEAQAGKGTHPLLRNGEDDVDFPCWSPAEYEGRRRSLPTLKVVHVVGLDFDEGAASWDSMRHQVYKLELSCLAYTTKSHAESAPALRLLFPLAEPLSADDFRRVREWLNDTLGGKADNKARDPSRYWWQPTTPRAAPFWLEQVPGRWVSLSDAPDKAPEPSPPKPEPAQKRAPARGPDSPPRAAPSPPPASVDDVRAVKRANKLLASQTARVGMAPQGQRESTLGAAAALLGGKPQSVAVLGKDAILSSLVRAAVQAGLPEGEARSKAERHFEWGAARPLPLSGAEQADADKIDLPDRADDGKPQSTLRNTVNVLEAPRYAGMFAHDLFADRVQRVRGVPGAEHRGAGELVDEDLTALRLYLKRTYGIEPSREVTQEAITHVANAHSVHPVREWLAELEWDGRPRIETMLQTYLGCEVAVEGSNTLEWLGHAARVLMLQAVARVHRPGCQADVCVVLHGAQGLGKSTGLAALAGEPWFADPQLDLHSKDAALAIQGRWLVELSELSAVRARDVETVRAFLTRREDRLRPPYGRLVRNFPRQCVFVGTSNEAKPFQDRAGNRRFLSVQVTKRADREALARDRAQLWAEAMHRYEAGEAWHLSYELEAQAAEHQLHYTADSGHEAWTERIRLYLTRPNVREATTADLLSMGVGVEMQRIDRRVETIVGTIMRESFPDWSKQQRRLGGVRSWVYARPGTT